MPEKENDELEKEPYMRYSPPPLSIDSGIDGIRFDFNFGARISVPKGDYLVRFIDLDSMVCVFESMASEAMASSNKRYFVNFRIEIYKKADVQSGEEIQYELIFEHDYNARGKNVLIKFADAAIGDLLGWFPYALEFQKKHKCHVYAAVGDKFMDILQEGYPELTLIPKEEMPENLYASYYVGLFDPWDDRELQPCDWRVIGLQQHAAYLLGVEPVEIRPHLVPHPYKEPIDTPYVCVSAQASAQAKYWNNPSGWAEVVRYLKELGYRVLCIDRDRAVVNGEIVNMMPEGSEDFTGNIPLQERIDLLAGADFFIGLTSGLSWLAWGTGIPVIMITGYTAPRTEFYTPYRVQHFHVCNSCCNDTRFDHEYGNFNACPRLKDTERIFECTRAISADHVKKMIDKVRRDLQC